MTTRPLSALAAAGLLALPAAAQAADPPRPDRPEFPTCAWREVKGARLSMWAFDCARDAWYERLVADDALGGFVVEGAVPPDGKPYRRVVVRLFEIAPDAPLTAIMPQVRRASPRLSPACRLVPAPAGEAPAGALMLAPVGPAHAQSAIAREDEEGAPPPCGDFGITAYGERVFQALPGHPGKVVFIDYGHEVQVFDATTLRLR